MLFSTYWNIHNAGKCKNKKYVKEGEEVSLGGEGGEEEADEGDAAEVWGGQAEQAKKKLHCTHSLSSFLQSLFPTKELSSLVLLLLWFFSLFWPEHPDF